jgi:hypothetical protein
MIMSDKINMLVIRACKLGNYEQRFKRLSSIHRRFYIGSGDPEIRTYYLGQILLRVMEEKGISMKLPDVIDELKPDGPYGLKDGRPYHTRVLCMLTRAIAFTEIDKIPGYIRPAKWRNNQ